MSALLRVIQRVLAGFRRMDAAIARSLGRGAGAQGPVSGDSVRLPERLRRGLAFGTAAREETWQLLADVTETGVDLDEALGTMVETCRRRRRMARALVLAEMAAGQRGGNLESRLAPYVSAPERLLLAGMESQKAAAVFHGTARLLRNRMAMQKAVVQAVAMPILLFAGLLAMVLFFGRYLLPALGEIVDFDTLPGVQGATVRVTLALSENPLALAWWIAGFMAALFALMRLWTGPGRALADRLPPFSVMRLQAGTGFLFSICEYGRAGVDVTPALLERMASATGRYEASRILALVGPFGRTNNLGEAALEAGQGFPDDEMASVLAVLWPRKKGIENSGKFLERRLERVEDGVRARMAVLNVILLTLVAGVLGLLLSILLPIFQQLNQIEQGMGV